MAVGKSNNKNQGGAKQPKQEDFNRGNKDQSTNVNIGDKVKGNVTTTSTGPRNPIKNKKT